VCGFVDDVMFSLSGALLCIMYVPTSDSITAETVALIPTIFCSKIKISKFTLWFAHRGHSLLSRIVLIFNHVVFIASVIVCVVVTDRWVISFGKKNGLNGILRSLNYCYEK